MKTVINSSATESFEFAKRILYSFQVLVIGLFIPLLFIIGINTNYGDTSVNETSINKTHQGNSLKNTTKYTTLLIENRN
ncbi:MAG: hypothetical protein M3Z26_09875 [Bacteroidota bacterium]|nr:hypothetical protein [Bacteroidota bacterium]